MCATLTLGGNFCTCISHVEFDDAECVPVSSSVIFVNVVLCEYSSHVFPPFWSLFVQMFWSCHREEEYRSTLLCFLCSLPRFNLHESEPSLSRTCQFFYSQSCCVDVLLEKNWVCWGWSTLVSRKVEASCVDRVVPKSIILSNVLMSWRSGEW